MIRETEGKSFADIVKVGLGILEARAKKEEEVRKQAHTQGYREGYAKAESLYRVTYPCSVCGKMLIVTSSDEKEAIKKYMREHGWGHAACHQRNQ